MNSFFFSASINKIVDLSTQNAIVAIIWQLNTSFFILFFIFFHRSTCTARIRLLKKIMLKIKYHHGHSLDII